MLPPKILLLCRTNMRTYTTQAEYILMSIIKALSALALYLLAAPFGNAGLTPIGPLNFASGATTLDFSAVADRDRGEWLHR